CVKGCWVNIKLDGNVFNQFRNHDCIPNTILKEIPPLFWARGFFLLKSQSSPLIKLSRFNERMASFPHASRLLHWCHVDVNRFQRCVPIAVDEPFLFNHCFHDCSSLQMDLKGVNEWKWIETNGACVIPVYI